MATCCPPAVLWPARVWNWRSWNIVDVLKEALQPLAASYDFLFIDCPPSLELLTLNSLCAAQSILIPVQCEYYALEGLSDLMATMRG